MNLRPKRAAAVVLFPFTLFFSEGDFDSFLPNQSGFGPSRLKARTEERFVGKRSIYMTEAILDTGDAFVLLCAETGAFLGYRCCLPLSVSGDKPHASSCFFKEAPQLLWLRDIS